MAKFSPQRILCPVDFSGPSAAALRVAGGLAQIFGAEVEVLHAQRLEAPVYFTAAQTQALKAQLRKSLRAGRNLLENFASSHLPDGVARNFSVVEEEPVSAILHAFKRSRADLIVMGTHGRTGLTRIRLGSVMESVLRQISGPIVTIGPKVKLTARLGKFRRVLSPIDFSDLAREAFGYASEVAEKAEGELIAAHIVEPLLEGQSARAENILCDWVPPETRARCKIREVVREGSPAERAIAEARNERADLIVQGAKPRGYWGALIFGSTTEAVIRGAACPVLSVIRRDN
jgi:nucleotide-binding universal stress UspA family protein